MFRQQAEVGRALLTGLGPCAESVGLCEGEAAHIGLWSSSGPHVLVPAPPHRPPAPPFYQCRREHGKNRNRSRAGLAHRAGRKSGIPVNANSPARVRIVAEKQRLRAGCPLPALLRLAPLTPLARAERTTRVWAKKSRPMTQICLHVSRGRGFPRSTGKRGFVVKCQLVGQERVSQVASGETPFFGDVFSWEMTPALLKKLLDSTPAVKLNVYHFDSLTARGPTEPLGHVLLHLKTVSTAPPCVCVRAVCICPSRPHPACARAVPLPERWLTFPCLGRSCSISRQPRPGTRCGRVVAVGRTPSSTPRAVFSPPSCACSCRSSRTRSGPSRGRCMALRASPGAWPRRPPRPPTRRHVPRRMARRREPPHHPPHHPLR